MSIRRYDKDHLKEHVGVNLVTPDSLTAPDQKDPLCFWTMHPTQNTLVDLTVFSVGQLEQPRSVRQNNWLGPFTGRPELIIQMASAIQEITYGYSEESILSLYSSLRGWWRILDAVETEAENLGQAIDRVESVTQLSQIHCAFAYKNKISRSKFNQFLKCANAVLKNLGLPILYWKALQKSKPNRVLPTDEQTHSLRIELKWNWEAVKREWTKNDRLQTDGFIPATNEESEMLRNYRYLRKMQKVYEKPLPTSEELMNGLSSRDFYNRAALNLTSMRTIAFPTRWEVDVAFHLCLANTGWNPAVLYALNADNYEQFLKPHYKDPRRYLLIGTKARSNDKELPVSGLWKTSWAPGPVIRDWMLRVEPLRNQLKAELTQAREVYVQLEQNSAPPNELKHQFQHILKTEERCRNIWLYVSPDGKILGLVQRDSGRHSLNHVQSNYLAVVLDRLNRQRDASGKSLIPRVAQSDFRDIFASYIWKQSGGNVFVVMRLLNHSRPATTNLYLDNNILNAERDNQARTFLDHLFSELAGGRVDATILAHLQQNESITPEMESRLQEFRNLQRSRIGIACTNPLDPPSDMQTDSKGKRLCASQRCLLCKTHAVILPESLSGVAMRVEELKATQRVLPVETWLASDLAQELNNGLDVLKLFPADEVQQARNQWENAIKTRNHFVPGIHNTAN